MKRLPCTKENDKGQLEVIAAAYTIPPEFNAELFFEMSSKIEANPHPLDLLGNRGVPMVDREKFLLYTGSRLTCSQLEELGCIRAGAYPVTLTANA